MLNRLDKNLWCYSGLCNVYILASGQSAILINCGDGSVLETLPELGITNVKWVLFTHHHRELCQGAAFLEETGALFAGPQAEGEFWQNPSQFRKAKPSLGDAHTCYGTSYLRLPIQPFNIDRTFKAHDSFVWNEYEFWCLATPGASPGAMSYLWQKNGKWNAFSGNVVRGDAKMHFWFDSEWDYGYGAGLTALHESAFAIERFQPETLFPAHGDVVTNPGETLPAYRSKIRHARQLLLRDWDMSYMSQAADVVSQPTSVPHVWQISEHLFKLTGSGFGGNFHMLLADSGHALVIDCGLWDSVWLDDCIAVMKERLGLKQIDAVIATHMHGDHLLNIAHLKEQYNIPLWTLDLVKDKIEHPEWFNLTCALDVYPHASALKVDRTFQTSEVLAWQGYSLTFDWLPGQTEYALILHGFIDGKKVAFTGDNIFRNPEGNGHDALCARAGGLLDEGYAYTAQYLKELAPDLILAGHSVVIEHPQRQLEKYVQWSEDMRSALQDLSPFENEKLFFDPYWMRAQPYRSYLKAGEKGQLTLFLRNHSEHEQAFHITPRLPEGWQSSLLLWEDQVAGGATLTCELEFTISANATSGSYALTFDIVMGEQLFGELCEALVFVEE